MKNGKGGRLKLSPLSTPPRRGCRPPVDVHPRWVDTLQSVPAPLPRRFSPLIQRNLPLSVGSDSKDTLKTHGRARSLNLVASL